MSRYLENGNGDKSSTRLIGFIVVIWTLVLSTAVLYWGKENVILAAAAAGTLFTTMAGPTLIWIYQQKKQERGNKD